EAEVHERLGDLAVADPERAVARHASDHALAGVDDPEVVETRDVDAVADELAELFDRVDLASRDGDPARERSVLPVDRRRRMAGRLVPVAGARGARAIPDDALCDAV